MIAFLDLIDDANDLKKFNRLYNQYNQLMYRVANRILKDSALAEDVVHDSFLKIVKHFDKFIDLNCPKTRSLIVTIVEHTAIDAYRKRQRLSESNLEMVDFCLADSKVLEDSFYSDVEVALNRLGVIYKTVLKLKYVQGFTVKEIAVMLEVSESTVQKRIERGKRQLANLLEELKG